MAVYKNTVYNPHLAMPNHSMSLKLLARCSSFAFVLTSSILLAGCGDKPDVAMAEASLQTALSKEAGTDARLISLKKTNGLAKLVNGVAVYQFEYAAEVQMSPKKPREGMTGVLNFIKTEQGWRFDSVSWETDTHKRQIEHIDRVSQAKQDIIDLREGLELYHLDNKRYPTQEQGLGALESRPTTAPLPDYWKAGGYGKLKTDPWGSQYQYRIPGTRGQYDLYSFGADRKEGGYGDDADIGNWSMP